MEIGSHSDARFLATLHSREAVVPESNVHFQLWGSSLPFSSFCLFSFLICKASHLSCSSFGCVAGTVWILEETFFDSHLGADPYLPKLWVYSDASNVILFSSYNRGQGPVVLGIVKMPCKRLYIIQMGYREGKQQKE